MKRPSGLPALRVLVLLASAVGAPFGAFAQRPAYAASLSLELDSATTTALLHELEHASARGVPTEPLVAKAREGRLKRAPGTRIRQAVAALSIRLDSARGALGPDASTEVLLAGAEALGAGAGPDALRAVRSASTQQELGAPLGALAQLVASGVSPARATTIIVDLLRRRVSPARLVAFGNAVESDVTAGLPPGDAALFRLRAMDGVRSLSGELTAAESAPMDPRAAARPPSTTSPRRRP